MEEQRSPAALPLLVESSHAPPQKRRDRSAPIAITRCTAAWSRRAPSPARLPDAALVRFAIRRVITTPARHQEPSGWLSRLGGRFDDDVLTCALDDRDDLGAFLLRHVELVERLVEVIHERAPLVRRYPHLAMALLH